MSQSSTPRVFRIKCRIATNNSRQDCVQAALHTMPRWTARARKRSLLVRAWAESSIQSYTEHRGHAADQVSGVHSRLRVEDQCLGLDEILTLTFKDTMSAPSMFHQDMMA
ncbi:hypothetical protein TrVFT333_006596 [Trichoderma virens FT-333]|nr:hypothetical protein TrVFT333_006596 [Trichoderma virens FT-333]